MSVKRFRLESWQVIRRRMLRETEVFLQEGLEHPDQYIEIPRIEVGKGEFRRGFSSVFWAKVLGSS